MVGALAGSKNFALWLGPGSRCACPGRRGERATLSVVVARLDRAIQYSRDACDQAERPACTGCPAFAGHDGEGRRDSTFSRHEMSEVLEMNRPRNQKRAQRMPDARSTHGRLCSKKAQASATTGTPQSTGGLKRSSQHRFFSLGTATRQAPPRGFSIPVSFSVWH